MEIIASDATAEEMTDVPPAMLAALNQAPGEVGDLFRSFFGEFRFEGIELVAPTTSVRGSSRLEVGGRRVELIEVGPAHTAGDTIVHVPDCATVYTGDILFIGGTPIVWAGPAVELDQGLRPDAGSRRRDRGARPRPGHRHRGDRGGP